MTLDTVEWPVLTERLSLRRMRVADADRVWAFRSRPEVFEWLSRADADQDEFVARVTEPERLAKLLVIETRDDRRIVGDLLVTIQDPWAQAEVADQARGVQAELGWTLDPAHQGHGYATEAVRAMLGVCFRDLGLRRVVANCFADNEASWRLMERVGMRRETHTVAESLHRSGRWLDGFGYAILADEWRSTRPGR